MAEPPPVEKSPKPLSELLQVTVLDGRYYCTCTDQSPTPISQAARPILEMDEATRQVLDSLGVKIRQEPNP